MKNEIFKANPQLDCYFETTDGECFFTDNAAKDHAKSLAVKTVKTHHKSDYVEPTEEVEEVVACFPLPQATNVNADNPIIINRSTFMNTHSSY